MARINTSRSRIRSFTARRPKHGSLVIAAVLSMSAFTAETAAAPMQNPKGGHSIADTGFTWPTVEQTVRVLTLRDYNTRIVVMGVTCLGLASGTVGTFLLLRKRSLTADALSHAALPGIGLAFITLVLLGQDGKYLPGLLAGAFVAGCLGVGCILIIRHTTRLKDDAALGIVLSVSFGLGVVLLTIIQQMPVGGQAGLQRFVVGRAASMGARDAWVIMICAAAVIVVCAALFKELQLLCFDQGYARAQGWPVIRLDVILMALVTMVTVIALQSVGLVLAVAILIIPAAAARFWTDQLMRMTLTGALIGMVSGYLGAVISALQPRMPTGPVIVLVCAACFGVSMVAGIRHGMVVRVWRHWQLNNRVAMQHLLRAMFEQYESGATPDRAFDEARMIQSRRIKVQFDKLLPKRSWTAAELRGITAAAVRRGLIHRNDDNSLSLTDAGWAQARRVVRNHRLWETYLIHYADIAPSHVDRDADQIEHVLGRDMVDQLERLLSEQLPPRTVPPSPHGA